MAIAGTLTVNVLARTLGFNKNIGSARKNLRGFRKEAIGTSAVMGRLQGALTGILGGLTVRAGFNFLRNQLQVADALGKTAETLDLTTGEIGHFQLAAKLAGVESRQLNIGIQRMSRRIGEAALGGGELSKTLIRLGLDAKRLSRLSVADQFEEIGEELSKITNQDEQLAAIFKTFDSEGVAVFRAFKRFEQARLAFKRFNLELKNADSQELARIADEATILAEVFGIQGRKFLIDIGPHVLKVMEQAQQLFAPRPKDQQQLGETAFEFAVRQERRAKGGGPSIFKDPVGAVAASFRESSRLIAREMEAGKLFKDPRNLPFGPADKPGSALPGLATQVSRGFNEIMFLKPLEEIGDLLRIISGNTGKSADATGGSEF